jgi:hypothetical protein
MNPFDVRLLHLSRGLFTDIYVLRFRHSFVIGIVGNIVTGDHPARSQSAPHVGMLNKDTV